MSVAFNGFQLVKTRVHNCFTVVSKSVMFCHTSAEHIPLLLYVGIYDVVLIGNTVFCCGNIDQNVIRTCDILYWAAKC